MSNNLKIYAEVGDDSDIYVYGQSGDIYIHVAFNRGPITEKIPEVDAPPEVFDRYFDSVIPLRSPEAGKTYVFSRRLLACSKLNDLAIEGLMVPVEVISALYKEYLRFGNRYYDWHSALGFM